jgi:ABC-type Fe3+ transport system permease subunit
VTTPPGPYPEDSQATVALVLGILSIVCIQPLGIAAWIMGNSEIKAIDQGRRPPENRGTAVAAKVCGIIGLALLVLIIIAIIAIIALGGFAAFFALIEEASNNAR